MEINKLKTDLTDEIEGRWFDIEGVFRAKLARFANKEHAKSIKELMRPIEKGIRIPGKDDAEKIHEAVCRAMANCVLLDWEGMTEGGKELPYSKNKAYELLRDVDDFKEILISICQNKENFRLLAS